MNMRKHNGDTIDWNNKYQYPLQWIEETTMVKREYLGLIRRVDLAMRGRSLEDLYTKEIHSSLSEVKDQNKRAEYLNRCKNLPIGKSFALTKAVQNIANQMSVGVDTYEYQIDDQFMAVDNEVNDLLSAKCSQDYTLNHLDRKASVFSSDLMKYGMTAVLVEYDSATDKNKVVRVNPKNVGFDTKYSTTGEERYRYYNTMISWAKLKQMILDSKDELNLTIKAPKSSRLKNKTAQKHVIKTLNDLDIYVSDLNKLATSDQLFTDLSSEDEYRHDILTCYNRSYYQTYATDGEARTNSKYHGDDVELTVLYDLNEKIQFKIINRRYVISMNKNAFRKDVIFEIPDLLNDTMIETKREFELGCPLKVMYSSSSDGSSSPYPESPIFSLLDVHDELCALDAKRSHVAKILSILRIETNASDARTLKNTPNIMGVVLDDSQGDIASIQFGYDYTHIDSEIARRENDIKEKLSAYNDFDALQMMGDRASAKEGGIAIGAVAQGLATHQDAIMELYADIARQCIGNRVVYSGKNTFAVANKGNYSSITVQEMALSATINVKSKLAKKVNEKALSVSAITLLGGLRNDLTPEGIGILIENAMLGTVPRKVAERIIKRPKASEVELQTAKLEAENLAMQLKQNQQAYEQNPIAYEVDEVLNTQSPEDIDEVITGLVQNADQPSDTAVEQLDMLEQEGAMGVNMEMMTPELGSMLANPNGE